MARWLAALVAIALTAGRAGAVPLDTTIDVESDDDLRELRAAGAIDGDTHEALAALLARGVDLERADRDELYALPGLGRAEVDAIVAYRVAHGRIGDPHALVAAGVIDDAALRAIDGFLRRGGAPAAAGASGWRGEGLVRTRWAPGDAGPPPLAARLRLERGRLSVGLAAAVTRLRVGPVRHDPDRGALVAAPASPAVHVPRGYLRHDGRRLSLLAGSYRTGFGLRLTFDTTGDPAPDGAVAADDIATGGAAVRTCREAAGDIEPTCDRDATASADPSWRPALFGVAAAVRGPGGVAVAAWVSRSRRSVYQYELRDRAACPDPQAATDDEACAAPPVYRGGDGPAPRLAYTTLPDVVVERIAGARLAVTGRGLRVGATAYGADLHDTVDGVDLAWAARPTSPVAAIGADVGVRRGRLDAAAEVARTDRGGSALAARIALVDRHHDVALSVRHLGTAYANPLARPEAAADELGGQRGRDEAGARLRYTGRAGRITVRVDGDAWRLLSTGIVKASGDAGLAVAPVPRLRAGIAAAVAAGDSGPAADTDDAATTRASVRGHVDATPTPTLAVAAHVQHRVTDSRELAGWLVATAHTPRLRLRGRVRYQVDDARAPTASSLAAAVDVGWRLGRHELHLRGDLGRDVAVTAAATTATTALSLGLDVEVRY
jgi:hypothetical protein